MRSGPPIRQDRPEWVEEAIGALVQVGADIEAVRSRIAELALELRARDVATADLTEAHHDLEHVDEHVTRTRRGLVMSWPGTSIEELAHPDPELES